MKEMEKLHFPSEEEPSQKSGMFTWLQRDTFSVKSNPLPSFWLLFVAVLKVNTIKRENSKSLKAQLSVDVFLLRLLGFSVDLIYHRTSQLLYATKIALQRPSVQPWAGKELLLHNVHLFKAPLQFSPV